MSRKDENSEFNYLNPIPDSSPSHQYAAHFNTHTAHVYAETPTFHPYVEPPNIYPSYANYSGPYHQTAIKSDHYPQSTCNNLMFQNGNYEMGSKERSMMFPARTFSGNDLLSDNSPIAGRSLRRLNTEIPISSANYCDFGTYDPFQGSPLEITNLGLHESRTTVVEQPYEPMKVTPIKIIPEVAEVPLSPMQEKQKQEQQLQQQQNEETQLQDIQQHHTQHQDQNQHQSKRSYKDVLTFPIRSESPVSQPNFGEPVPGKLKIDNETRKETYKDKLLSVAKSESTSNVSKTIPIVTKTVNLNNHRSQPNNNPKKPLKINNNLASNPAKATGKGMEKNWHSHNESVRSVRSQTDLGGVKKRNRGQSLASTENTSFEFPPSDDEDMDDGDGVGATIGNISIEVRIKEKKSRSKVKEKENERGAGCSRRSLHKRNPQPNSRAAFARAYLPKVVRVCVWFCIWLYNLCVDILRMSWDLTLQGLENCQVTLKEKGTVMFNWLRNQSRKGSRYVITNWIPPIKEFFRFFRRHPQQKEDGTQSGGLNANIPLPTTGEEAMHRLLACKGRDPYSILGVRRDSSDEEIRRYYKRQAVLVHPDKNRQRGAEEAFKILAHAFELIGQPERRSRYDQLVQEADEMETAWAELNQLLTKLHAKMDEAANTIRCTNCAKRHRRLKTDRPCYAARYCQDCKIHHSAREGDLWAESRYMGLLSNYYACMEGAVYDITDWANCQAGHLRHLQSNSHRVQYRIVPGQGQSGHHGQGPGRSKLAS